MGVLYMNDSQHALFGEAAKNYLASSHLCEPDADANEGPTRDIRNGESVENHRKL